MTVTASRESPGIDRIKSFLYVEPMKGGTTQVAMVPIMRGVEKDHCCVVEAHDVPNEPLRLWLMEPGEKGRNILIPLVQDVRPVDKDTQRVHWDTALVPVLPMCVTDAEQGRQAATAPRPGWLYIFVDGYLWREVEVRGRGEGHAVFCEVDLAKYALYDERPATGAYENLLLLPHKLGGRVPNVHVLYSEVQLSWSRIIQLGDMPADDPRWDEPLERQALSQSQREALEKRATKISFDSYPDFATDEGPADAIDKAPNMIYTALHRHKRIAVMYLPDPLGVAHRLADTHEADWFELERLVDSLASGIDPKNRSVDTQPQGPEAHQFAMAALLYQIGFSEEEANKRYGKHLNRELLEMLLAVDERKEIRERIKESREALLAHLDAEPYQGVLEDFRANTPERILLGKAWVAFHQHRLALSVHALDGHLDLPEQIEADAEQDPGIAYIKRTLQGENTAGRLVAQAVQVHDAALVAKWGDISTGLVSTFAKIGDPMFIDRMAQTLNSVEGRGLPRWEVLQVDYPEPQLPKGYRTVPGALRTEIVEHVGGQTITTTTDTPAARQILENAGMKSASGMAVVAHGAHNLRIFPAGTDPARAGAALASAQHKVRQLAVDGRPVAHMLAKVQASGIYSKGFMGLLGLLQLYNLDMAVAQLREKGATPREISNVAAAITGGAAFGFFVRGMHAELAKQKRALATAQAWQRWLGAGAWLLGGFVAWFDASRHASERNEAAAMAYRAASWVMAGLFVGTAMGLGFLPLLPGIILAIGLMVLANHLQDDPLQRFAKNSPFRDDAPLPEGADLWARIRYAADHPQPTNALSEWQDLAQAHRDLMDMLMGYQARMSVFKQRSAASNFLVDIRIAQELRVTTEFRRFERGSSELEHELRIYPRGLSGESVALKPNELSYTQGDTGMGVKSIQLTYTLPNEIKEKLTDRAEALFLSRLRAASLGGEDNEILYTVPVDGAGGEYRYLGVRQPLSLTSNTLSQAPIAEHMAQARLFGEGRMVGTRAELENPRTWGAR